MILAGTELDLATLKEQTGNVAHLQSVLRKFTGRDDLVIKEVTNWQGEWRFIQSIV